MAEKLLEVKNLTKYFPVKGMKGPGVQAVENVSLFINKGETLGLVGESGCGKTTLGRTILRLHEPTSGQIIYDGKTIYQHEYPFDAQTVMEKDSEGQEHSRTVLVKKNVAKAKEVDMFPLRRKMQIIFQDPAASLDPRMTVGDIIGEAIDIHHLADSKAARTARIKELLGRVGLNTEHANRFPHEFSGGQRQRINIARALSLNPDLLVCDEPVSALDVSIQAQVLNLFGRLQEEFGLTYVFISHDLSVIKHISDRIAIMYLGQVVELCGAEGIYDNPLHPYTRALLSAVPPSSPFEEKKTIELKGDIPSPIGDQVGCPLASRCPHCTDRCRQECPSLKEQEPGHQVACFLYES